MIKKILLGSLATFITIFIVMVTGLIRTALAVRYLPATETGIWFIFLNVITLISFCDFGLSPTLSREIGFAFKKKVSSLRISNLFFTIKKLINFLALLVIILLSCFGYFYLQHLSMPAELSKKVLYAFMLFSFAIMIQFQANPYLAVIYGVGNVACERYLRAISSCVGALSSVLLIMKLGYGLYGLVAGFFLQAVLLYFLSRYFLLKNITIAKNGRFLQVICKRILEPSLQWTIMGIGAILIFQISNLIIAYLLGVQYVTQFAVPFQIFTLIVMVAGIVGYVITPLVAQAKSKNDQQRINYFFSLSTRSSTAIAIAMAVFIYFFIVPITQVWLGHDFVINQRVLLVLLIVSVFEAHHVSCAVITMATGYVKFAAISMLAGVLNLIFSFAFIHSWGIFGAALSFFVSQVLTNNWYVVFIALKKLQYSCQMYFFGILLPLMVFFIYIVAAIFSTYAFINVTNLFFRLLSAVLIVGLAVCFGSWLFLLSTVEKRVIKLKILGAM